MKKVNQQKIAEAVQLLIKERRPEKVILFGSYARGAAAKDSDVDLLVIVPEVENKFREMIHLRRLLRPLKIPIDVLVFSEKDVHDWGSLPGTVLYWALKEGKVLYERI